MNHNLALKKSLTSLTHPATLIMVMILVMNDHVLKHTVPSWWTGKLSDIAGLAFAPLVLAVFLSLIIPLRLQYQEQVVIGLAVALISGVFALIKLMSPMHQLFLDSLYWLTGNTYTIVLDPSDVLTLPAVLIAWWIWQRTKIPKFKLHYSLLSLTGASLAIMATCCSGSSGITCVSDDGSRLFAITGGDIRATDSIYWSTDGGYTWYPNVNQFTVGYCNYNAPLETIFREQGLFVDPQNADNQYLFTKEVIKHSTDGGRTWVEEYDISNVYYYLNMFFEPEGRTTRGQHSAVIDSATGNVIVGMASDGILVRSSEGKWGWVSVDKIGFIRRITPIQASVWLRLEYFIIMTFVSIVLMILNANYNHFDHIFTSAFWGVMWLAWLVMFFPILIPSQYPIMEWLLRPLLWVFILFLIMVIYINKPWRASKSQFLYLIKPIVANLLYATLVYIFYIKDLPIIKIPLLFIWVGMPLFVSFKLFNRNETYINQPAIDKET